MEGLRGKWIGGSCVVCARREGGSGPRAQKARRTLGQETYRHVEADWSGAAAKWRFEGILRASSGSGGVM